jgi:hypothetical protein
MRNLRVTRRADDMPLYGKVARVAKGKYQVVIKAKASKRIVDIEELSLPSIKAVKRFYAYTYPTLTWGEPKFTRKGKLVKPRKRKAKKSDKERLQRTGTATRHCQA